MARLADATATRDAPRPHATSEELTDMIRHMSPAARILALAGCAALALLGATSATAQRRGGGGGGEAELARALAGRVAGRPVNCITLSRTWSTQIIKGTAIIYQAGRTSFVNRPRSGASLLDDDNIIISRSSGGQLCRLDPLRLVDRFSRIPRGTVVLDQFVPYTRPRANQR